MRIESIITAFDEPEALVMEPTWLTSGSVGREQRQLENTPKVTNGANQHSAIDCQLP
jgi:hypothetical protein